MGRWVGGSVGRWVGGSARWGFLRFCEFLGGFMRVFLMRVFFSGFLAVF